MDAELPLHNVRTVEELLDANVRSDHFTSRLLSLFAALALGLAGVGTYGVMASTVEARRRELGIRAAMGARPTDAFWAVVRDGSVLVLAGIAIGGVLAASMSDALEGTLYTVDPLDPLTYALTAGFLALVGLGTVAGTALRAATADPAETLRTE